jgi:hypothetical protein
MEKNPYFFLGTYDVIKIPIFLGVLVWGDAREKGECGYN